MFNQADLHLIATRLDIGFFDYQMEFFKDWMSQETLSKRACLYYRTGAGKSLTALTALVLDGWSEALVVAPPSTQTSWYELADTLGIRITVISHAKFRQKNYQLSRTTPVIADEFHMFGGHKGMGWKKLEKLSQHLAAPLILCSATPNYNDAERCYCVQRLLDPVSTKGGYLAFLYQHCDLEPNPFGREPLVSGFTHYADAAEFLAALPHVYHVPDDVEYEIVDIEYPANIPDEFERYGLFAPGHRIVASQMEARWRRAELERLNYVNDVAYCRQDVWDLLEQISGEATTPLLIFSASSLVARRIFAHAQARSAKARLITGGTHGDDRDVALEMFKRGELDALIGTTALATGTDGLDKVCDYLVIVHDTDDPSLRRQIIGRILPRGEDTDASNKHIYRLLPT